MSRNSKISAIITLLVVVVSAIFAFYHIRANRFRINFQQVKIGQSKQSVMDLMGQESEKTLCNPSRQEKYHDINCDEIYGYYSVLDYWAIAFDKDGKVVKKYFWTFDDGYDSPYDFKKKSESNDFSNTNKN